MRPRNSRISVRELIGRPVTNRNGRCLGRITDVIVDRQGRPGFLALELNRRHTAPLTVPWSQVQLSASGEAVLDVRRATLDRLQPTRSG